MRFDHGKSSGPAHTGSVTNTSGRKTTEVGRYLSRCLQKNHCQSFGRGDTCCQPEAPSPSSSPPVSNVQRLEFTQQLRRIFSDNGLRTAHGVAYGSGWCELGRSGSIRTSPARAPWLVIREMRNPRNSVLCGSQGHHSPQFIG